MERVYFYKADSEGRITETGNCTKEYFDNIEAFNKDTFIGQADLDTQYVKDGQLIERPSNPVVFIKEPALLENVPKGSLISINDTDYPCPEGGTVELEFDQPGTYLIRVICWPYLDKEFEIEN